jgi:hypothetical protein
MALSRGSLLTILVLAGLAGFLLWSTLRSQQVECTVCVAYGGGRNCATASAQTEEDAARQAQSTACGVLAGGMNDAIACGNRVPETRSCRAR